MVQILFHRLSYISCHICYCISAVGSKNDSLDEVKIVIINVLIDEFYFTQCLAPGSLRPQILRVPVAEKEKFPSPEGLLWLLVLASACFSPLRLLLQ